MQDSTQTVTFAEIIQYMHLTVKQGRHYSDVSLLHRFPILDSTILTVDEMRSVIRGFECLDSTATHGVISKRIKLSNTYNSTLLPNQQIRTTHINKLWGLCFGFNHHKNSFRFGWEHSNIALTFYHYYYADGVRKHELCATVKNVGNNDYEAVFSIFYTNFLNKTRIYPNITGSNLNWCIGVDTPICIEFPRRLFWFNLYPYFGGVVTAPKDLIFTITDFN